MGCECKQRLKNIYKEMDRLQDLRVKIIEIVNEVTLAQVVCHEELRKFEEEDARAAATTVTIEASSRCVQ